MRGYAKILRDLPTNLLFCRHLTRSVDISRPAPENSLALFYDNPRKLTIDRRQLALYNISYEKEKQIQHNRMAEAQQ